MKDATKAGAWLRRLKARPRPARHRHAARPGLAGDWLLEERCLLASGPPYTLPIGTVGSVDAVLYNGVSGTYAKTITVYNNSPTKTVYAFLEGQDSRQAVSPYEGTAAFDPYDTSNQEYRGYIGYTDGTTNYAGIPPLTSVTVTVPLVFWDSGRLILSTDGADQFSTYGGDNGGSAPGAPFYYHDTNTQATYFGTIAASDKTKLILTPAYDSFDPANGYMPTTANWKSPVTKGELVAGQSYVVTGPGLPGQGLTVTADPSHPNYLQFPVNATNAQATPAQYTFTAVNAAATTPTARYIQPGFTMTPKGGAANTNGVVMWYHALTSQAPNNDAPFQLTEFTFRGTFYDPKINVGTGFQYLLGSAIDGSDTDSADYDISFVDTINLPVAMEASNVTIPNTGVQAPFGWVGSSQTLENFQAALAAFASKNPNGGTNANYLGNYFGGQGYPAYLSVDPGNVKLPAGQNVLFSSPAVGGAADIHFYKKFTDGSVINSPLYALTSGGSGPSLLIIGGDPSHPSQGRNLGLNTTTQANQYILNSLVGPNLAAGFTYQATYNNAGGQTVLAGNVTGLYRDANGNAIGVQLDRQVPANAGTQVYSLTLPQTDYAASGIAGLWYSWAKYYADNVRSTPVTGAAGVVSAGNVVTLAAATPGVVPGMAVTGAGVPPGTVVLGVGADQRTLQLSTQPAKSSNSFNFAAPTINAVVGYDPTGDTPPVRFTFPAGQQAYALAFARTVYLVMSSWSVSVPAGTPNAWNPLLLNIIGGNLGTNYLPNANTDVVNALTNLSKSALRGVPDFTSPLYSNPAQWYPDPALSAGGLNYNAFNLNPFVWFIHDKLGITAYAFALDDDVGNVNGGGANHLDVAIGGLDGLPNKDPYTPNSPWGVVTTQAAISAERSNVIGGLSNPKSVYQIAPFDYNHNVVGTLVNGPGVPAGTTVQFTQIPPDLSQARLILSQPLTSAAAGSTYAMYGPMTFTATVLGSGQGQNTLILNSPDAYNTLLKLGPLTNVQVTGEGIDPASTVTVQSVTKNPTTGVVTITLSANLVRSQVSQPGGYYAYTFGSPVVGIVRDPGFEWANVQGLAGNFNHGYQLSQNTVDWTFTDSPTNSKNWFAGIAYGTASTYTTGNPTAPQGLQVGFVQGDSRITQAVTLGAGTYALSFYAAQSGANTAPQSLQVLVDGKLVGTVNPAGATYALTSVPFTATAGRHVITFQGVQASANAVLLDSLAVKLTSASIGQPPTPQPRPPARLEFLSTPPVAPPRTNLGPVRVLVQTALGDHLNGVRVRLRLIRVPGLSTGHLLPGSVVQARTVDGVATFNRLAISRKGVYVLRARAGNRLVASQVIIVGP